MRNVNTHFNCINNVITIGISQMIFSWTKIISRIKTLPHVTSHYQRQSMQW